tara:strand:- start:2203 stop:2415 length:213 start_codon:yes stop_codon:yes gene_type:complete
MYKNSRVIYRILRSIAGLGVVVAMNYGLYSCMDKFENSPAMQKVEERRIQGDDFMSELKNSLEEENENTR